MALVAGACGGETDNAVDIDESAAATPDAVEVGAGASEVESDPTPPSSATTVVAPSTTATPATTESDDPAPTTTTAPTTSTPPQPTNAEPAPGCRRLTHFASEAETDRWFVILDGVMGGRSDGELAFADSALAFTGVINTNGGGFSSFRLDLDEGAMAGVTQVMMRTRSDGRAYELTFQDSVARTGRLISHQVAIPATGPDDWATVTAQLSDLEASAFGNPIDTEAFDPDRATQLGVILADGIDGSFELELDWIDLCEPVA